MPIKWSDETALAEANKYVNKRAFQIGEVGAYTYALKRGLLDLFFGETFRWSNDTVQIEAKKYGGRKEFQLGSRGAFAFARKHKILSELFPADLRIGKRSKITREHVIVEAAKYLTKVDFQRGGSVFYKFARIHGMLDDLFVNQRTYWTKTTVVEEARKYVTKSRFMDNAAGAYKFAVKHGIIDDMFDDSDSLNTRDCVYIWAIDPLFTAYKVGITSESLGVKRIRTVAALAGFRDSHQVVIIEKVGRDRAKLLEMKIKTMGVRFRFSHKFDGCTEFRSFAPSDIEVVIGLIRGYREAGLRKLETTKS